MTVPRVRVRLTAAVVAVGLVFLAYSAAMVHRLRDADGNYSAFLQLGQENLDADPLIVSRPQILASLKVVPGGYDAQFMYLTVFDPLLRAFHKHPAVYDTFIDAPPYRFGRIGFVWLVRLASLNRWRRYPVTMVWLVLLSIVACAGAIALAADDASVSPLWGLLALLIPAFWASLATALPEPVAAACLAFGYLAWRRERWLLAGSLFALSVLIRETGLVLVGCLTVATVLDGHTRKGLTMAGLAVVPCLLWRGYVGTVLYPTWGLNAFVYNPHVTGLPFVGLAELWRQIREHTYPDYLARAGLWFPVVLTAAWIFSIAAAFVRRTALAWATAIYATVAISLNYSSTWVHVGNGQRTTYELFVTLALLSVSLVSASWRWRSAVLAVWTVSASYVFWASLDAPVIRQSIVAFLS